MMNKLFLIYIAFNLAVVYAQPTNESSDLAKLPKEQRQCAANKMMLKTLANLMEADKRGEVQNVGECSDLTGCLVTLAGTIAACAADLVDWPLVVACVAGIIGTGNQCYDCVCDAVEWTCQNTCIFDCSCDFC